MTRWPKTKPLNCVPWNRTESFLPRLPETWGWGELLSEAQGEVSALKEILAHASVRMGVVRVRQIVFTLLLFLTQWWRRSTLTAQALRPKHRCLTPAQTFQQLRGHRRALLVLRRRLEAIIAALRALSVHWVLPLPRAILCSVIF